MPTTTTNYALYMYNATTDQAEGFADFRADIAGISADSNMQKLDVALDDHDTEIALLQARRSVVAVDAIFTSGTLYEATVSEITAYADNYIIDIVLDTDTNGTMTLQINALVSKPMMKINAAGTAINLDGADLQAGRHYLFSFDLSADKWLWVAATGGDQINVEGTTGNLLQIASDNSIEDSTKDIADFTENTDTDVSGNSWVLDEDDLSTDSDTKVPTQQSVKAYVDGKVSSQFLLSSRGATIPTTSPCASPIQVEFGTNDVDLYSCAFSNAGIEYIQWSHPMPSDYGGGVIIAQFYWYCPDASTNSVVWYLEGMALGDNNAIDSAWGSPQGVIDPNNANAYLNISDATSAITIANTPVAGDMVQWRGYRDPGHVSDNLAVDANLLWIAVSYTRS